MGNSEIRPLVSVIMPVYNASKYLKEAVESVLNQTYRNIELLAIDDGSKDNSLELLLSFNDPRLRVFTQMNQGAGVARNRGLQESRGEYVKYLDSDDVLYPESLAVQVEQMLQLADNEEVFGDFDFIDGQGKAFYHSVFSEKMQWELEADQDYWVIKNWDILTSCPLHRKESLLKVGGFDNFITDDQERMLHIAMSLSGIKFVYRPGAVYGYRTYESADRLSCIRVNSLPRFTEKVYKLDLLLQQVQAKYGEGYNRLSTVVSDSYFSLADKYFLSKMTAEGRYCLSRSKSVPHFRKHPRYCLKYWLAVLYVCLGHIVGYHRAAVWMEKLTTRMGLRPDVNEKVNMLFHNPYETKGVS